jgi:integrase
MGRKKPNKSLIQQVKERLDSKLAIGESKFAAKLDGTYTDYIFSWDTYRSYLKHDCYFVKWCREQPIDPVLAHKPRTLEECRIFAERWVQSTIDRGLSAYTVKLEVASLAKLYGCKSTDFDIKTPARRRADIKRSRGGAARDKHFSVSNNQDLITFCKCTGLRRAELEQIRGTDLIEQEGKLCLDIKRGAKGGRLRVSPVVGSEEEIETVKRLCAQAGESKVFPNPSENADIHSFRSAYATRIYNGHKREYKDYKNERLIIYKNTVYDSYVSKDGKRDVERFSHLYKRVGGRLKMADGYQDVSTAYYCRNDRKGIVYDRKALFEASRALGHNRFDIIPSHYLYV